MIKKSQDFCYETALYEVARLRSLYPFASFSIAGRTWCSRSVFSMSVGEGEECVLFAAGIRGQEWLTPALLLKFFERLCEAYSNDEKLSAIKIRNALKERKIVFVPLINPDSLEIAIRGEDGAACYRGLVRRAANEDYTDWNANARGVDIARNFEYCFPHNTAITIPSPKGYQGPSPFSEPESRAMANLCENYYFKHMVLLSSTGETIHYNSPRLESDTAMMAQIFRTVCGYSIGRKSEKEKCGGFCEWFTDKYKNPSFEIKVGRGKNPLPFDDFNEIYENLEELLVLSSIM